MTEIDLEPEFIGHNPAELKKQAFDLHDKGFSIKQIAKKTGFSPPYIHTLLYPASTETTTIKTGEHDIIAEFNQMLNQNRGKPIIKRNTTYSTPHMKIVTINVPDQYLDCVEIMVNNGFFPSRSEVVREALKEFLTNEVEMNKGLKYKNFEQMKKQQMNSMLH